MLVFEKFFECFLGFFLKLFYGSSYDGSYDIVIPGIVVMALFATIQIVLCFLKKCPVAVKLLPVVLASFFLLLQNGMILAFSDSWGAFGGAILAFPALGMIGGEYLAWLVYGIVRLIARFFKKKRGAKAEESENTTEALST